MEAQLEKELSFHLEQHASQLMARGRAPDEARREARLALGGPEQVKEKCRDVRGARWLEDLLQDTRYALRTFRQKPGFTLVALLILSLGIGATTVMFTVINSVLLRPLSYPEPDRLVTLRGFTEQFGEFWGFSNLDFGDTKRESQTLALAAWTYGGGTLSEPGEPEYVNGRQISAELFSTLGISPVQGRAFRPDEDRPGAPPVAMISYGLWQRDFGGDASTIGRSLVYEGKPYTVVGIAPAGFQLDGDADVFTPLEQRQNTDPRMQNRSARFLRVMARPRPGFDWPRAGLSSR
jgi:MacB-like periplasmic core domain